MRFAIYQWAPTIVALSISVAALSDSDENSHGTSIPIYKHSSLQNADQTVNVDALKAHIAFIQAKMNRGFVNFAANTGETHSGAAPGSSVENLTDWNDSLWYGDIAIGEPLQNFTVVLDTGSSDLFVPKSNCKAACGSHKHWDPSSSSTAIDLKKDFQIEYGGGASVEGKQYRDTVSISGFKATNQTLGAATSYSIDLQEYFPADGLLGLGFHTISSYNASSLIETLASNGQMANPSFSFKLSSTEAELYIGGSNSSQYTGNFTYTPVTKKGYWEVKLENIKGDGETVMKNLSAIIDTGTSLILGDPSQVYALHKKLGGKPATEPGSIQGSYTFPCQSFPSISFTFGNRSFPISNTTLNLGRASDHSSECVSGIAAIDIAPSFWIIGEVFLRSVYTNFDLGKSRVGFADLA